jgi:flagellar biosynthesis/type III secretory pathway protein FliH
MVEPASARVFEIAFRAAPRLRDIVRAAPHLPLPTVPSPKAAPIDPAQREREERQAIEQVLTQLRKVADQFGAHHDAMIAEMRQAAIELAMAVAGRVVFDKLQAGEFPIEEMVRQALAHLPEAPARTVYLHPDDLALLRRRLADQPLLPPQETSLRIEADSSLNRGGCRTEAGEIHVRADLADQLAALRQQLLWSATHARSGSDAIAS